MDIKKLKIGARAPEEINVVIEIARGSAIKYEIDAESGELEVDRTISSALAYPFDYGFIPETLSPDGDALDAMVISASAHTPETVVVCRSVGLLEMADEQGGDNKILCVPQDEVDPAYAAIHDLADIDAAIQEKIKLFFAQYKEMEKKKWSRVQNFRGREEALAAIDEARAAVKK